MIVYLPVKNKTKLISFRYTLITNCETEVNLSFQFKSYTLAQTLIDAAFQAKNIPRLHERLLKLP